MYIYMCFLFFCFPLQRHTQICGYVHMLLSRTVGKELCIGLFARRDIAYGEELTIDYQLSNLAGTIQKCHCESTNCRQKISKNGIVTTIAPQNHMFKRERTLQITKQTSMDQQTNTSILDDITSHQSLPFQTHSNFVNTNDLRLAHYQPILQDIGLRGSEFLPSFGNDSIENYPNNDITHTQALSYSQQPAQVLNHSVPNMSPFRFPFFFIRPSYNCSFIYFSKQTKKKDSQTITTKKGLNSSDQIQIQSPLSLQCSPQTHSNMNSPNNKSAVHLLRLDKSMHELDINHIHHNYLSMDTKEGKTESFAMPCDPLTRVTKYIYVYVCIRNKQIESDNEYARQLQGQISNGLRRSSRLSSRQKLDDPSGSGNDNCGSDDIHSIGNHTNGSGAIMKTPLTHCSQVLVSSFDKTISGNEKEATPNERTVECEIENKATQPNQTNKKKSKQKTTSPSRVIKEEKSIEPTFLLKDDNEQQCLLCGALKSTFKKLHVWFQHTKSKHAYPCKQCDKRFTMNKLLAEHLYVVHGIRRKAFKSKPNIIPANEPQLESNTKETSESVLTSVSTSIPTSVSLPTLTSTLTLTSTSTSTSTPMSLDSQSMAPYSEQTTQSSSHEIAKDSKKEKRNSITLEPIPEQCPFCLEYKKQKAPSHWKLHLSAPHTKCCRFCPLRFAACKKLRDHIAKCHSEVVTFFFNVCVCVCVCFKSQSLLKQMDHNDSLIGSEEETKDKTNHTGANEAQNTETMEIQNSNEHANEHANKYSNEYSNEQSKGHAIAEIQTHLEANGLIEDEHQRLPSSVISLPVSPTSSLSRSNTNIEVEQQQLQQHECSQSFVEREETKVDLATEHAYTENMSLAESENSLVCDSKTIDTAKSNDSLNGIVKTWNCDTTFTKEMLATKIGVECCATKHEENAMASDCVNNKSCHVSQIDELLPLATRSTLCQFIDWSVFFGNVKNEKLDKALQSWNQHLFPIEGLSTDNRSKDKIFDEKRKRGGKRNLHVSQEDDQISVNGGESDINNHETSSFSYITPNKKQKSQILFR
ncbi:hypothetical protein RFI_00144 [Reticulomyxa filosa]|uniref:C2H2-type domain-containing protein n=1 Tax=Reticulomyxa filosa TaxID=46433 RepID=X6PGW8_RETFI|nr:hypothetical protein RFI_00144 [Reticulomyxa filosa]|eukprot:ETO36917.1 hypothetical protein RFI_00144 [Reticulomyxa filosa]